MFSSKPASRREMLCNSIGDYRLQGIFYCLIGFSNVLIPDTSPAKNTSHLKCRFKPPGFKAERLFNWTHMILCRISTHFCVETKVGQRMSHRPQRVKLNTHTHPQDIIIKWFTLCTMLHNQSMITVRWLRTLRFISKACLVGIFLLSWLFSRDITDIYRQDHQNSQRYS
jgi:hypothetical protein